MDYLFMDEKGPQETFEISTPFNKEEKLKNGTDRMHSYVADVIKISEGAYKEIESKYLLLEAEVRKERTQINEIKGENILNKTCFEYGVASLHDDNYRFRFIKNFFELLVSHIDQIDNLLFEVGKMSIVVDSRLNEWIFSASETKGEVTFLLKYTLTKYMENEAPEVVIKNLLDKKVPLKELLLSIKDDMTKIICDNKGNQRMAGQIRTYQEIVELIDATIGGEIKLIEPDVEAKFNWEKVAWALDLMLLEIDKKEYENKERVFYLDEGIPSEVFQKFNFKEIKDEQKSNQVVGIRIVDMLVFIAGKYISGLFLDSKHDHVDLQKKHLLSTKWFEITSKHFDLIKLMKRVYFPSGRTYSINIDTYFDDIMLFITFVKYISSYQSYLKYNILNPKEHTEKFMQELITNGQNKFKQSIEADYLSKDCFGSVKETISRGVRKPL
ncbi:MAG: hypothetical protein ACLUGL_08340 [Lactococcus lactis]|uniref:hypothetical protein n=1 Tax=Lactococcus TaxID=1357 RepID=UPI00129D569D|nr:hypothetical protein [Lactococcus lactis]MEE0426595.1 hypothetical protein [Turicibacter sp.]MRM59499.1 hypothetical protein [Lactococcus cremoris]MDN5426618.1 hypothetical protein [Lactococcus lactis]MDN5471166.1 hypothetical protein [Lactococcus lactis]MDN6032745.1 hypothetical protein [Lactococcus lactis]